MRKFLLAILFITVILSVNSYAQITNVTFTKVENPCNGNCIGTATANVVGGSGNYTYLWNNGQNTQKATNLCGTSYSLLVTDVSDGIQTGPWFVQMDDPLPLSVSTNTPNTCVGFCTATATATGHGGTGAYTFLWSINSSTTSTISGLCAGPSFSVTVTDANNCTNTEPVTVTVNPTPTLTISGNTTICSGNSTNLTVSSTNTGMSYIWQNSTGLSQTTGSNVVANPASTTTYTITGTDSKGCVGTATVTITVNNLPGTSVNPTAVTICSDASQTLVAKNAVSYTWAPSTGLNFTTGATVIATPGSTRTYTVTGTNTCGSDKATSTITVIASPTLTVSSAQAICNGSSTTLTVGSTIGGTTYIWSPSSSLNQSTGSSVIASPTIFTTYTVTGTSGACSGTATIDVTVNSIPTITVSAATTAICAGFSTTATASGATTYTWSPSTGLNPTTGAIVNISPAGSTTYTITGTSAGCAGTTTLPISIIGIPTVLVSPNTTVCSGSPATLTAQGATTYTWSPSTGLNVSTGSTVLASPAVLTTYTVTGGSGSCSSTNTVTVDVTSSINADAGPDQTICNGSSINLSATPNGASSYSWAPPAGLSCTSCQSPIANPSSSTAYTVTITSGSCSASDVVSVTVNAAPTISVNPSAKTVCANTPINIIASGVGGGGSYSFSWSPTTYLSPTAGSSVIATPTASITYTITGTDISSNCFGTATSAITVNALPIINVSPSSSICLGSSATLTADGAGGSGTYIWSPASSLNTFTGTIVTATPTTTTIYTVTGTDNNGCSNSNTSTVNLYTQPSVVVSSDIAICSGTSTVLTAGGSATSYIWTPSTGLNITTGASVTASPTTAGPQTYTVTGSDGNGCNGTASVTVTVNAIPIVNPPSDATICFGGSAVLASGGTGTNTYVWSPSTGLNFTTGTSVTASPTSTVNYTVVGTDGSTGCSRTRQATVTVNSLPTINTSGNVTICAGALTLLTAGGANTYTWNPSGSLSSQTSSSVVAGPVSTTDYTITGTDGNNCSSSADIIVTVNPLPTVTTSSDVTSCSAISTELTAGGTALTYTWSPSTGLNITTGTDVTANATSTTTYTVTGDDSNCTNTATVKITVNALPSGIAIIGLAPSYCDFSPDVTISGSYDDSIPPGAFAPSPGLSGFTWSPATAGDGTYTIKYGYTDPATGCTDTASQTTIVGASLFVSLTPNGPTTFCSGDSVTLDAGGPYASYLWTPNGETTETITVDSTTAGSYNYNITVTQGIGCSGSLATDSIVTVNPVPTVTVTSDFTTCAGTTNQLIANGVGVINYSWSPNTALDVNTGSTVNASPTTTITYTVTGDNGVCSALDSVTITTIALPTLSFTGLAPSYCLSSLATPLVGNHDADGAIFSGNGISGNTFDPSLAGLGTSTITYSYTDINTGCSNSISQDVIVGNSLTATITPDGPSTFCQGDSVVLDAGAFVDFLWSDGETTQTITVKYPGGDYSVTVDLGDPLNCSGGSGITTITVNAAPPVSFNPIAPSYCTTSSPVTLIPNHPLGGAFSGEGVSGSTFDPSDPSIVLDTPFDIKYVYTDGVTGCSDSTSQTTIVDVQLHPAITPDPVSLCQGSTAILDAGPAYTAYLWSTGETTETITINSVADYSVTVQNTGSGCSGNSQVVTPTLNTPPIVSFTGLAPSYCSSSADDTLHGIPSGGSFSALAGITDSIFSPSSVTPGSSYDITYTSLPDINGCTGTSTQTTIVDINLTPNITVSGSTTFCQGGSVNLNTDFGYDTYLWTSGETVDAISATVSGNYFVTVTLGGASCSGVSATKNITVNSLPTVTMDNLAPTYCTSSPIANLTLSPAGGTLSGAGTSVSSFNPGDPSIILDVPFTVKYVYTDGTTGCSDSASQSVTVSTTLSASINPSSASICDRDSVILDPGSGYTKYLWSPNGETTETITVKTQDNYSVYVENGSASCSANASSVIIVNPLPTVSLTGLVPSYCLASDSSILKGQASPLGGIGTYIGTGMVDSIFYPATAGLGTFTIKYAYTINATGCTDTASQTTIVSPTLSPSITANASTTNCLGNTLTLDVGAGYQSYSWSPGGATTETLDVNTTGIYSVTVTNGCTGGDSKVVVFNLLPTVVVTPTNTTICSGTAASLTASGSATSYVWSPASDLNSSTGTIVNASPTTFETYTVTGSDANCPNTATVDIFVNAVPAAPLITLGGNTTICDGDSVSMDAGLGYTHYLWFPGGETSEVIEAKTGGGYNVLGFNDNNCSSASSTDSVFVKASPTITATQGDSICLGATSILTASGGGTYSWSPANGLSSITDATVSANPVVATTYTLAVTNDIGCIRRAIIPVDVSAIDLIDSVINPLLCSTSDGSINVSVGTGILPYTFVWSNGASTQNLAGIPAGTYSLTLTDAAGCMGLKTINLAADSMTIANAGDDTLICSTSPFPLNGSKSMQGITYRWYLLPSMDSVGADALINVVPPTGSSSYLLVVENGNCISSDTINISYSPFTVNAGNDFTMYVGGTTTLGGSPTSADGVSFSWNPNNRLTDSSATNPNASPTITTTYTVTVKNTNGCAVNDDVTINVIPEVISTGGFSPNGDGINDYWTIENIESYPNCLVEIYNRWGELLFSSPGYTKKWDGTYNGKKLPIGTYYFIINLNDPQYPNAITGPITILR